MRPGKLNRLDHTLLLDFDQGGDHGGGVGGCLAVSGDKLSLLCLCTVMYVQEGRWRRNSEIIY